MKKKVVLLSTIVLSIVISIFVTSCSKEKESITPGSNLTANVCPSSLSCPSGVTCGCETVSGLSSSKSAVGDNQSFESAAMMETELMNTDYTYGDGKTGDAFNAGRTKMNYGEARLAGVGQGSTSAFWNYCVSAGNDVSAWTTDFNYWGSCYYAVHRNGITAQNACSSSSAEGWEAAMNWTYSNLSGHTSDNVRFWCDIPSC